MVLTFHEFSPSLLSGLYCFCLNDKFHSSFHLFRFSGKSIVSALFACERLEPVSNILKLCIRHFLKFGNSFFFKLFHSICQRLGTGAQCINAALYLTACC